MLLPYLPSEKILNALAASPGNEVGSGKFASPESSAALAANAFGYFLDRAGELPPLPGHGSGEWAPEAVRLEAQLRFPWRGGRHPWLDALVVTKDELIGIESKRYEPYRLKSEPSLSDAYFRPVWGDRMKGFNSVRDGIATRDSGWTSLDAAQLVKHAYGLRTSIHRDGPFKGRRPLLLYVFAEPATWSDARPVDPDRKQLHRAEIDRFAEAVAGDEVNFAAVCYRDLIKIWSDAPSAGLRRHAANLLEHFDL